MISLTVTQSFQSDERKRVLHSQRHEIREMWQQIREQSRCLMHLQEGKSGNLPSLRKMHRKAGFLVELGAQKLNTQQREAVASVLVGAGGGRRPLALFGPPGTGKTVTLVECALQVSSLHRTASPRLLLRPQTLYAWSADRAVAHLAPECIQTQCHANVAQAAESVAWAIALQTPKGGDKESGDFVDRDMPQLHITVEHPSQSHT